MASTMTAGYQLVVRPVLSGMAVLRRETLEEPPRPMARSTGGASTAEDILRADNEEANVVSAAYTDRAFEVEGWSTRASPLPRDFVVSSFQRSSSDRIRSIQTAQPTVSLLERPLKPAVRPVRSRALRPCVSTALAARRH